MARPREYNHNIIKKVRAYINQCTDVIEEYHKTRGEKSDSYDRLVRVKIPTIEGLSVYLGINRDTVYAWKADFEEFSDIIDELMSIQADRLLNEGLSGSYNPTIAKVLLTKHGYNDKIEQEHSNPDGNLKTIVVNKYGGDN